MNQTLPSRVFHGRTLLSLALFCISGASQAAIQVEQITETPKGSVIQVKDEALKNPLKPLTTPLYQVQQLGFLMSPPDEGSIAHLLVSGLPCRDCEEKVIFLLPVNGARPVQFVYPGRIYDAKNQATLLNSRAFFGRCMSGSEQDVYIVFQEERVDRRRGLQSSVYVAEPGKEFVKEKLIERRSHMPKLTNVLKRVKGGTCSEIAGRSRPTLRKPLDLNTRVNSEEDAESESEDATKENQTQKELPSAPDPDTTEGKEAGEPSAPGDSREAPASTGQPVPAPAT